MMGLVIVPHAGIPYRTDLSHLNSAACNLPTERMSQFKLDGTGMPSTRHSRPDSLG